MSTGFSPAQLRASLWAKRGARVHAVVDGMIVPGLPEMLRAAETVGWDCLRRGALSAEEAEQAAYLAELKETSPFTDWILGEASATYPGWGVLMISTEPLLPVRELCRSIGEAVMPDGERRLWRWHDPEVLTVALPIFAAGQLDEIFALQQTIVIPASDAWTWLSLAEGVLATDIRPVLAASR